MKISKLFAGLSVAVLASAMTISASADSSFTFVDTPSDPWVSGFGSFTSVDDEGNETTGDDYIDARTFTRDEPMHVKVDFEWSATAVAMAEETGQALYMVCGPGHANGWTKFGNSDLMEMSTDYPEVNTLPEDSEWTVSGENLVNADGEMPDIFVKADGFIKITNTDITSFEFDLSADAVNAMIDLANEEDSWEGILFQIGGSFNITGVTVSQDNVLLASQYEEAESSDSGTSEAEENSETEEVASGVSTDTETDAVESSTETADSSVAQVAEDSSVAEEDDGISTGAVVGIAVVAVAVIAAVVALIKKKK